jgi:putative FmdB family regulatory protein
MPLYEFECENGHRFEGVYLITSKPPPCPKCGKPTKRLISLPAYFKITGYPKWVDRIDDHQKRQAEKGEKPTLPQPKEVL